MASRWACVWAVCRLLHETVKRERLYRWTFDEREAFVDVELRRLLKLGAHWRAK